MNYRINFNGQQAWGSFETYKEARRAYDALPDRRATWIQWRDPETDEWFTARQWMRDKAQGEVG